MYSLAVVASHPIQYQAPLYRALAKRLRVHVFYAHQATPQDQARAGFGQPFEWDVPLLDGYPSTWLENSARRPGVHHFFGCNTPGLKDELASRDFDALLVNGWNLLSYWQGVRAARRRGLTVLVRGDSQLPAMRSWLRRLLKRILYPVMLRQFDGLLAVGQRHREYLAHYWVPADRIFLVPHCVDNQFFAAAADRARQAGGSPRRPFGIPDGKVVFLFVGKFIPKKRPIDFLHALDGLGAVKGSAWALMVGDGPLRQELERHARDHQTPCSFAGFLNQSEIGAAYAAADVLVLPSDERETWGLVVNEAMAAGLPAIVSERAGCVPDLIISGKTGFVYGCRDVEALSRTMATFAADPDLRSRLSKSARRHIRAYSIEAASEGLVAALRVLVPQRQLS